MRRKSALSEYERGQIVVLKSVGKSNRYIAQEIGRSHNVVNNLLKNSTEYGVKKALDALINLIIKKLKGLNYSHPILQ